jgi:predicted amidophosphoribosyltransferase
MSGRHHVIRSCRQIRRRLDVAMKDLLSWAQDPPERCLQQLHRELRPLRSCPRCGQTVGRGEWTMSGCGACRDADPLLDGVIRVGPYRGALADQICAIKYGRRWELAGPLGRLLARRLRRRLIRSGGAPLVRSNWVVVPMPMPRWRRWHRGFDHARLLAESLAKELQLPLMQPLARGSGPPQATLNRSQRLRSPLGGLHLRRRMVFVKPSANLRGRGIVLVDDVLTTGRSLRAAGMLLERLGPALLLAAVLAVTDHR